MLLALLVFSGDCTEMTHSQGSGTCFEACNLFYYHCHRLSGSVGEHVIAAPTGGESPVRAAPAFATLLPTGIAYGRLKWSHCRPDEVGGWRGVSGYDGHVKRSTKLWCLPGIFPLGGRCQDLRNKSRLAWVLTLEIHPIKTFGRTLS